MLPFIGVLALLGPYRVAIVTSHLALLNFSENRRPGAATRNHVPDIRVFVAQMIKRQHYCS